ncbi:hypothetical protein FRB94_005077 [Tulasnella sp. JGI-2019a]|nr:hypothetical protein FRB93_009621 [Tulasnella sp. JGI-2019a]KAG9000961.1 hypothetical protein FRB94_005077 [Tulasnella sp. JGI-2019a]
MSVFNQEKPSERRSKRQKGLELNPLDLDDEGDKSKAKKTKTNKWIHELKLSQKCITLIWMYGTAQMLTGSLCSRIYSYKRREYGFSRSNEARVETTEPEKDESLDMTSRAVAWRRQKNCSASMHQLSFELLEKIFWLTLRTGRPWDPEIRADYYEQLRGLAQVAKLWSTVVRHSTYLWAVADSRHSRLDWTAAIKLSKCHPLTVWLDQENRDCGRSPSFWDAVAQHLGRWQSAHIHISSKTDITPLATQLHPSWRSSH